MKIETWTLRLICATLKKEVLTGGRDFIPNFVDNIFFPPLYQNLYVCENKFEPCVGIALFYGFYSPHNLAHTFD
jgi:hypothetical protein